MKHIAASLAIGACLLLPAAGVVFAAPNTPNNSTNTTGQRGAAVGTSCETLGTTPGHAASANGSPFNSTTAAKPKKYAGNPGSPTEPTGDPGTPAVSSNANTNVAISEYDVACLNHSTK